MKILITGANGYVGSHLLRHFSQDHTTLSIGRSQANYPCHLDRDPDEIPRFPGIDAIIHCAANPNPTDPTTLETNTRITHNLLERYPDVKYFVFLSSLKVYGNWLYEPPYNETFQTRPTEDYACDPACLYGISKLACEKIVNIYAKHNGFTPVIFRLGPVVGSDTTHGVFHDFIEQANKSGEIIIRSKPPYGSTKPYTHIDDVVSAVSMFPQLNGLYNLCLDADQNDIGLAFQIKERYNISSDTKFTGETWPMDTPVIRGNSDKLRKAGWLPRYDTSVKAIHHALYS